MVHCNASIVPLYLDLQVSGHGVHECTMPFTFDNMSHAEAPLRSPQHALSNGSRLFSCSVYATLRAAGESARANHSHSSILARVAKLDQFVHV